MGKHSHEMEAKGEKRWGAKVSKEGGLMVTDLASDVETQASAYTHSGGEVRFALPGDNGLRVLASDNPSYGEFAKAIDKINGVDEPEKEPAPAPKAAAKQ